MNKNILLLFIILCYLSPIMFVFYNYTSNNSVSNIICDENCKNYILFFMVLMGIGTLLYELERNDKYSQIIIDLLLIATYGLIYINETHVIHYYFAFVVFIAMLFFMIRHCYLTNYNIILISSFFLGIITLLIITININNNIFCAKIIYILNFAFYYLYLHFIK